MTRNLLIPIITLTLFICTSCTAAAPPRQTLDFNPDWRFALGEQPNAHQTSFDDTQWQSLRVPHDWAIAGPFDPNAPGNTGKLPWKGEGWYRKTFTLSPADADKRVFLNFDGVMAEPRVYVNGQLAGQWDYGYMAFQVDITPHLHFDKPNVVAVHCDTRNHGSRWYPGAGIFRDVQLVTTNSIHIPHWGIYVTTPTVTDTHAVVRAQVEVDNTLPNSRTVQVITTVLDPAGNPVARRSRITNAKPSTRTTLSNTLTLSNPQRWDVDHPHLYTLVTEIRHNDTILDRVETRFGIRTFKWTADDGFHLNGRRLQLQGVNLHHDLGPLGAAFNRRAMQRQLEIMKDMGVNAIRTSHNPPAAELLDLCDEMGLVVFDEAFDKWDHTATYHGGDKHFDEYFKRQLTNFIRRDRNHPSIVVWSIGNEIGYVLTNKNNKWKPKVDMLVEHVRALDPTRPVTMGNHGTGAVTNKNNHVLENVDIMSWNYNRKYALAKARYPDKPTIYSESASALSERGFFHLPLPAHKTDYVTDSRQLNAYDMNGATWSDMADVDLLRMEQDRYCAGEFVWTGFDYIGEPTPYNDQWVRKNNLTQSDASRSSYFGIVDLAGIPKDRFYLYRSHWRSEQTTVHIMPHWNWSGRKGAPVPVMVFTNGDSAELFLNGRSLGTRHKGEDKNVEGLDSYYSPMKHYRLCWLHVPYQPGTLKAVAYQDGKPIGQASVTTAGPPATLRLTPDRATIHADGQDLSFILVEAIDKDGNLCPFADNLVKFHLQGPGSIAAVGNGAPRSLEPFVASQRSLFYGKAVVIIRSNQDETGAIQITATAQGLTETTTRIKVE